MVSGSQAIGLEKDGKLVAGVIYEGFNGFNVWMHVAAEPGRHWLTRDFLGAAFLYPFVQLNCNRVSGYVEAWNEDAKRFDEHLGFKQEAILKGAASDGGDVILYVMPREGCRYVPTK
ncbi:MAG: GNAT family N-acetyltransferase [Geobacteraceae bacterium]|nr:GNAT family N-acetyltransferase [Geobacteraceae bacterium]